MDFPSSPTIGQEYTYSGRTWRYNGKGWQLVTELSVDDIAGLQDELDDKPSQSEVATALLSKADLIAGKVPETQLPAMGGLGIGQTWQDVTASRASGVAYQNVTGKPIALSIAATSNEFGIEADAEVSADN